MIGFELDPRPADELCRFIRTLGKHRYVASRLHLVHAFVFEAAGAADPALAEAYAWARRAIDSGAIELASKDERLWRRASDAELGAALEAFWVGGADKDLLRRRLAQIDAAVDEALVPFDEAREEDVFPILIDAGWELLPLAQLDLERHKGAIQAFDDFEVARFEEESAIPAVATLHELPLFGGVELLGAIDDGGTSRAPFVLWQQGHETYLDYVLRGVVKAAKLDLDV